MIVDPRVVRASGLLGYIEGSTPRLPINIFLFPTYLLTPACICVCNFGGLFNLLKLMIQSERFLVDKAEAQ